MDEEGRKYAVLLERVSSDMQAIKEQVSLIPEMRQDIREMKVTLREHSADLKEIRGIVGGIMEDMTELKAASHTH